MRPPRIADLINIDLSSPHPSDPQPAGRITPAACGLALLLILLTFFTFLPVLHSALIDLDDNIYITDNRFVQNGLTLSGLRWAWTATTPGYWQPLSWVSLMLDTSISGPTSFAYHRTNLLLHSASAGLIFLVLFSMTGSLWRCALVAAIYAVHPLRVESVAWAAERKDVLSNLLAWLAIAGYLAYARKPSPRTYLLVLVPFALALLAKPMVITLPCVLLLLDYWPLNRFTQKSILCLVREKLPLLLVAAAAAVTTAISQRQCHALASFAQYPLASRIGNSFLAYSQYLLKMVWFPDLAILYPIRLDWSWPRIAAAVAAAIALASFTAAAFLARKRKPWAIVGWLWFLGVLLPVCGISQAGPQSLADRFTYMPSVGLILLAVWSIPTLPTITFSWPRAAASAAVILALCVATQIQTAYWRDEPTLFHRALAVTEDNWIAHDGLAFAAYRAGDLHAMERELRQSLLLNPADAIANLNLGICLSKQGRTRDAVLQYRTALNFVPGMVEIHDNLGVELQHRGHYQAAYHQFVLALDLQPDFQPAHSNLGGLLVQLGMLDRAIPELRLALSLDPNDTLTQKKLDIALSLQNQKSPTADSDPKPLNP